MSDRLPPQPGEWIDRDRPMAFRFEGDCYQGYAGDVIASALWAHGVRMTGRSFKYHRPRGAYSMAGHDANAMLTDGARTNLRGDTTPLAAGMDLCAVNTFGGLKRDRMRIVERFSRFMPVGFYYKAFHRPAALFPYHERQMRKVAGLGRINITNPPPSSPKDYAWCDVLVVGSGPAGLAAVRAAADTGLNVIWVEQEPRLGGSIVWQHGRDPEAFRFYREQLTAVQSMSHVEVRTATMVGGCYTDLWLALFDATRMTKLRARSVVFATGVIEQPAVFGHNDTPGVMLASAAQRLIRHFAVRPFRRAVVLAANTEAYAAALDLLEAGVEVAAVVDLRPQGENSPLGEQVAAAGVRLCRGSTVYETVRTRSRTTVRAAVVCPLDAGGSADPSRAQTIECDGIAVSVGWMPNASLLSQAGVRFTYSGSLHQLVPHTLPEHVLAAGRVNGIYELSAQFTDGRRAGLAAARALGKATESIVEVPRAAVASSHPFPVFKHSGKKNFVDMDEDLHLADFANAHQEGYDSVELLKRYSTVGMGPSQGKLSNMNAVRVLAKLNNKSINDTGTTTARPFYQPVTIGHLAGRRFHPIRHTPMHDWHIEHEAVMFHAGNWLRPEYYRRPGCSRQDCILAEAQQVRCSLGLIDLSTLGKLFIQGPDAVTFLERFYTGRFTKLAVGKSRYGVALDESGIVIDDGVIARLADDRFYATATSSGAAAQHREMLRWALIWGLDVTIVNATGQFAAMNLAGPRSRDALAKLTNADLSESTFPYQALRECRIADVPAMVLRVGFVGELGYEVHVPAWQGDHVWRTLIDAGKVHGVQPFGVEAQRLLRLEKGHLIVSHDTDALTHPHEAGMSWAIPKNKPFFVGQRSLRVLADQPQKRKLVGIRWPEGYAGPLPEECHLIIHDGRIIGRVTSIAPGSTLGYPLGMAFVAPEHAEHGTTVAIRLSDGSTTAAQVVKLPFYDPDNTRQKAEVSAP